MSNKTNTRFLWAILLFAAGFAAHALYVKIKPTENVALAPGTSKLEDEIQSLTDQLASVQTENAHLQSKLEETDSSQPEVVTVFEGEKPSGTSRAMPFPEERFREMMSRQVKQQVDVYAARLNLSDDQRGQLEEIMLMRMMQMRERIGPDGPRKIEQDQDSPFITQTDIDNFAAEILSPEQLDEYDEMRAQENASRSEMMATAQLSQIAPQLGLSESQKDLVYSIYYNQSLEMVDGFTNPESMQDSQAQADEQIREILDDEQRAVFKTIKENQNFGNFTIIAR